MTIALANAYAVTFSEDARSEWAAARAERHGPDPRAAAQNGVTLAKLAARHPGAVRAREN